MNNLRPKVDIKRFWDKWKPYFSNKDNWNKGSNILLVENETIMKRNLETTAIFISLFKDITNR